jgi:hypothetical protein
MTTSTLCPKCSQTSTEADFCSECGAKLGDPGLSAALVSASATGADPRAADPATTPPTSADVCPTCQTPRPSPTARFCEVCRYDFVKGGPGEPPVVPAAAPTAFDPSIGDPGTADPVAPSPAIAAPPAAASAPVAPVTAARWDVIIAIDPNLDVEPEPGLTPPDEPERRIPLDQAENLIGRRSDAQNIVPDVRPHDPGVSRRHAKLLVRPDGTISIVDLDSANGTFVNDVQLVAGVARELSPSDVITLGRWTRLRVEPRTL